MIPLLRVTVVHMSRAWLAILFATVLSGTMSCTSEKTCTLRGCEDSVFTVLPPDLRAPAGNETITVTADGVIMTCTFDVSPDAGNYGEATQPQCSSGLTVNVDVGSACTLHPDAAFEVTCLQALGAVTEEITVTGAPKEVRIQQVVGGTVLFDQTVQPTYQTVQPNGPGCAPICHQANTPLVLEQKG